MATQDNTLFDIDNIDDKQKYMLLDRLRQDCDYYLREHPEIKNPARNLYFENESKMIRGMRELWYALPEKPEWLSLGKINDYALKMNAMDVWLPEIMSTEELDKLRSIPNKYQNYAKSISGEEILSGDRTELPAISRKYYDKWQETEEKLYNARLGGDQSLIEQLEAENLKARNTIARLLCEDLYLAFEIVSQQEEETIGIQKEWVVEQVIIQNDKPETRVIGKIIAPVYAIEKLDDNDLSVVWTLCNFGDNHLEKRIFDNQKLPFYNNLDLYNGMDYYKENGIIFIPMEGASGHVNKDIFVRHHYELDKGYSIFEDINAKVRGEYPYVWKFTSKKEFLDNQLRTNMMQYIESLQYPDDFLSGDMSLLPEENYDQYIKHIRAIQEYENLDPDDFFIDPTFPPEEQNYTFFEASQDSLSKVMQTGDEFVSQLKQSLSSLNLISIDNSIDNKVETSNYSVADSSKSKDGQKFADYMKSLELPNELTSGNPALLPWQNRGLLEVYHIDTKYDKEYFDPEYPDMIYSARSYNIFCSSFKEMAVALNLDISFVNDEKIDLEILKPGLGDIKAVRASIDAKLNKLSNRNILDVKLPVIFLANNGNKLYVSQIYETDRHDLIAKINGQTLKLDRLDYIPIQDKSVQEIIVKGFGEQLGLKEHYQQFVLPEVYGISHDDIRIECDLESNYQIIISRPSENIIAAPLSKNDADAIHNDIATIEQLAAKYLYNNRFTLVEQQIQQVMEPEATYGKTVKQSTKNNKNMTKKKTDNPLPEEKKEVTAAKSVATGKSKQTEEKKAEVTEKAEQKVKRPPQLVTPSGDAVTHAHWYTVESGAIFFTAKLNGEPLKPQLMDPADALAVDEKKTTLAELFAKYYPTKMLPKISPDEFKFPRQIETSKGDITVAKYNVYKDFDKNNPNDRGTYRFYAQVGDKKMSAPASREDLNGYFDRTTSPKDQIIKSFGDRLKLPEHYAQFQLPDGMDIPDNKIIFKKGEDGKSYDIIVTVGDNKLSDKMSYHDTSAFFDKTATRQQLAAKYFGAVLPTINVKTEQKQETVKSLGIK